MSAMRIVVAVGGNALIKAGQAGHLARAAANVREIAEAVLALRAQGHEVVLTHGNGPHVGALLLQNALGEERGRAAAAGRADRDDPGPDRLPARERLRRDRPARARSPCCSRACSSTATTTRSRTRPSRSARSTTRRRRGAARTSCGWDVAPDAGRGWRRVVPSPHPLKVFGAGARASRCSSAARWSSPAAAAGSPSRPATARSSGVAGVIDKDRCSERLAVDDRRRRARAADRRAARGAGLRHALGARARRA